MAEVVPIRVLHVIGSMNRGGAESMIMELYRAINRDMVQFDFVEHTDSQTAYDNEILSLGGRIYNCPQFIGRNIHTYRNWWKGFFLHHKGEYQIIHGHIGSTAAIYLSIAKKNGLFTIAHSHSSGTDHSVKSIAYRFFSWPTRYIADWFFACSNAAGMDRYGKKVIGGNHFSVLNNAINTARFKYNPAVRAEMRNELGLTNNLVIGHVGRFDRAKNQRFLIPVLRELVQQGKDVRLLLIGAGPEQDSVKRLAQENDLYDQVVFTGLRSDVDRLLQAMDVFLFPSVYEGLPVTLVEAQCAGLPCVISSNISDDCILIPDLITKLSLSDPPLFWAERTMHFTSIPRLDLSKEVCAKGFDATENAHWLGEFYLEKYCR